MADFEAPSFSLGFDIDFDRETQPPPPPVQELIFKQTLESKNAPNAQSFGKDEDFQLETLDSDLRVEDSPPQSLKRLKRGPRSLFSHKRRRLKVSPSAVDEIEVVSSQEDPPRDEGSLFHNHTACSTSKFPPKGYSTPTAQFVGKLKPQQSAQASNASAFTSMELSSNKLMLPKSTISPLRRFQLVDSDSDEPSDNENLYSDDTGGGTSTRERFCNINQSMVENPQKKEKVFLTKSQNEDLWKDFIPKTSLNIPTPALDEFCEEYFSSAKDNNVDQSKEDDICVISSEGCYQKSSISENVELRGNQPNPILPAYKYFYHDDPRIQRLVRQRLPNFFPLDDVNNRGNIQSDAVDIDYMCQFGQRNPTSADQVPEGSSRRGRKNQKQSNMNELSQVSASWVNPKSCTSIPKNAGKRRVSAGGNSTGNWYTGQDGRKVFVTENGQELTGQMAYRQYRKASGSGFKRSKKKAASKRKPNASKKKSKR